MQSGETAPTSPAVAFAVMLEVAAPPTIRISPVVRVLWTLTVNAGMAALDERVTPATVAGKLNVTVSADVPPNPLSRA
jgi:hypothetical protein